MGQNRDGSKSALTKLGPLLMRSRVRAVLAWTAVSIAAALCFYFAWTGYDRPHHPQGNIGHVYIDFSGQWLMGRMLVRGEGRYLYNKAHLREAIGEAYQADDAATIDGWLIESEERSGLGGPLYPPIHALLFYPLGLLPPQRAYRIDQLLNFSLTFAIGFLAWRLTPRPSLGVRGGRHFVGVPRLHRRDHARTEFVSELGAAVVGLAIDGPGASMVGRRRMGTARVQAGLGGFLLRRAAANAPLARSARPWRSRESLWR